MQENVDFNCIIQTLGVGGREGQIRSNKALCSAVDSFERIGERSARF